MMPGEITPGTRQATPQPTPAANDDWYNKFSANSDWKDTQGYSPEQWEAWKNEQNAKGGAQAGCPPHLPFTGRNGQCAAKPDDCPDGMHVEGSDTNGSAHCVPDGAGGGVSGYNGGGGGFGGGGGAGVGGPPAFQYTPFVAPSYQDAMSDPGYQFARDQGLSALEHNAAAAGTLRTSGTLKGLIDYGQQAAAKQYGDVYNRALQTWGAQYQGQKDAFAPQYGGWQTMYNADLQKALQGNQLAYGRWQTGYSGDLQRELQREQNIYGLINTPPPGY